MARRHHADGAQAFHGLHQRAQAFRLNPVVVRKQNVCHQVVRCGNGRVAEGAE